MTTQNALTPSNFLEGAHGIHLVPHSPYMLEEMKHGDLLRSNCESFSFETRQRLTLQRAWQQRPPCLRPIHSCVSGDKNVMETIANVLTSLPFIALGVQAPRKNLNCKLYANSLIGVGIASSLYHGSRGKLRKYLRWADYTMIATATVCLTRALRNENPKLLLAASAVLLPIQPLMVSAVHTGMMEVSFAKIAFEKPELRMAHNVHKMSSLLGGALFIADDVFPKTPFLHAGWHLAAAIGDYAYSKCGIFAWAIHTAQSQGRKMELVSGKACTALSPDVKLLVGLFSTVLFSPFLIFLLSNLAESVLILECNLLP